MIAVVSLDDALRISGWDAGAEELFGYSAEEVLGRWSWEVIPGTGDRVGRVAAMREPGRWEGTVTVRGKGGRYVTIENTTVAERDDAGHIVGYRATSRPARVRRMFSAPEVGSGHFYGFDGEPIEWDEWGELMLSGAGQVARDEVGGVEVSTVWLGLDYGFGRTEAPLIYETLIFGGVLDGLGARYATREEALAGHAVTVEQVRGLGADGGPS